jgi:di/tricarboxylate transporter
VLLAAGALLLLCYFGEVTLAMEIAIVLGLLVLAIVLFALEVISVDLLTLLLLLALVQTGILTPDEAFQGFSTDIIIILASIFVMSGAMQLTGVVDVISSRLLRIAGKGLNRLTLLTMATVGGLSAFMNNTTATALFVGPVLGVSRHLGVSPSKVLMAVAYASILGGTCTLIGTSTNVAVSGYIAKSGMEPLSLFEVTPIGLIILSVGMLYMMLIGTRLLPDYPEESLTSDYAIREYLSEIIVLPDSHMIGQAIFESDLARMDFRILEVIRGNRRSLPRAGTLILAGDVLLVKGKVEELMKVKTTAGIEIKPEHLLDDPALQSENIGIAEILINPRSELIGRTLKEAHFRQRNGLTALALYREGQPVQGKIGSIKLRFGDLLLVQGARETLQAIRRGRDLTVLEELSPALYRRKKGLLAALFFILGIVMAGSGLLPLSMAFLLAAVLTVLFRCITVEEAYQSIDWRLLILIGGMTAFGLAMDKTGTAEFLAKGIAYLRPWGITTIMAAFFVLTIILTQPMSNAAAALVVLPVALSTAHELGVNQRTFAISIMLAASISFIAPFEPACILVYGPGKYHFRDFVRTGVGLTLLLMVVVIFMIPVFWPLHQLPGHTPELIP